MIKRDLVLTINNNTASLNQPVTIYSFDRGIRLEIQVREYKFITGTVVEENFIQTHPGIVRARALIKSPDGKLFKYPDIRAEVTDDKVIILISSNWTDEYREVGNHYIQIHLYDTEDSRVTLPPFYITVEKLLGYVYDDEDDSDLPPDTAITDVSSAGSGIIAYDKSVKDDSDIIKGFYDRNYWKKNQIIMPSMLNKVETRLNEVYNGDGLKKTEIEQLETNAKTTIAAINELVTKFNELKTELENGITSKPAVTTIDIVEPSRDITVGQTHDLDYLVLPSVSKSKVAWKSSNNSICTVSSTGTIKGISVGNATIECYSVEDPTVYDRINITVKVKQIELNSIYFENEAYTIGTTETLQLTPMFSPANTTYKEVEWSSNNSSVSVDQSGLVTGLSKGNATITCKSIEYPNIKATANITVVSKPKSITINNPLPSRVDVGHSVQLEASVSPSDADFESIVWESSDPSIATVDSQGNVDVLTKGSFTISCYPKGYNTIKASTSSLVNIYPDSISLEVDTLEIDKNEIAEVNVIIQPEDYNTDLAISGAINTKVSFNRDDLVSTASINKTLYIKALSKGTDTIRVMAFGRADINASLTVNINPIIESLSITAPTDYFYKNSTLQLDYTWEDSSLPKPNVTWSSLNEDIATVDQNGLVTGISKGYAFIKCAYNDEIYNMKDIDVLPIIESITITGNNSVDKNGTTQLDFNWEDSELPKPSVTWSSLNEDIATVDQTGLVTGVIEGNATIRCTYNDTVYGEFDITVNPLLETITITGDSSVDKNGTLQLDLTWNDSDVLPKPSVTWLSLNEDIATVDENGLVNGVSRGNATIRCSYNDDIYDEKVITVNPIYETINITGDSSVDKNGTLQLDLTWNDSDVLPKPSVTWSSLNENIATVDQTGLVTGVSRGNATIRASYNDAVYGEFTITVNPIIESITITGDSSVDKNYFLNLDFTWEPSDLPKPSVTWSSLNEDIATVDQNGQVVGQSKGEAVIRCSYNDDIYDEKVITVNPIYETLTITGDNSVDKNSTLQLDFTWEDSSLPKPSVKWYSQNKDIATVDLLTGLVTGISKGEATIKCYVDKGAANDYKTITVNPIIESINITGESSLDKNSTLQLDFTWEDSSLPKPSVTWSSLNEDIATVDQSGLVTGVSKGTATIRCTYNDTVYGEFDVTVNPILEFINITGDSSVDKNGNLQLDFTWNDSDFLSKPSVTWSSLNENIVTVDQTGLVTGLSRGTATIRCKYNDNIYEDKFITVNPIYESLTIAGNNSLDKGDTLQLDFTWNDSDVLPKPSVTWSSDNLSIAAISSSGLVTARSKGEVTIKCQYSDTVYDELVITVNPILESIHITGDSSLDKNSNLQLDFTWEDSSLPKPSVTWSSLNEDIATVDQNGLVTGLSKGNATIRCTYNDSIYGDKTITVNPIIESISITGNNSLDKGNTLQLDFTWNDSDVLSKPTVTWSSSSKSVATVDQNGLVTGVSKGNTTIRCAYSDTVYGELEISVLVPKKYVKFKVNSTNAGDGSPGYVKINSNKVMLTNMTLENDVYSYEYTGDLNSISFGGGDGWKNYCDVNEIIELDTSNVIRMDYMFYKCTSLNTIPDIDTSKVTNMTCMYEGCTSLKGTINPDNYWNNSNITRHSNCFLNCTSLDNYYEVPEDWGGPTKPTTVTISGDSSVDKGQTLQLSYSINVTDYGFPVTWSSLNEDIATVDQTGLVTGAAGGEATIRCAYSDTVYSEKTITVNEIQEENPNIIKFKAKDNTGYLRFRNSGRVVNFLLTDMQYDPITGIYSADMSSYNIDDVYLMFMDSNVTEIIYFNNSIINTDSYNSMFYTCSYLKNIDFMNEWDMSNVTDIGRLFYDCTSLTGTADPDKFWNNPNITDYGQCFKGCTKLSNYSDIPSDWK